MKGQSELLCYEELLGLLLDYYEDPVTHSLLRRAKLFGIVVVTLACCYSCCRYQCHRIQNKVATTTLSEPWGYYLKHVFISPSAGWRGSSLKVWV